MDLKKPEFVEWCSVPNSGWNELLIYQRILVSLLIKYKDYHILLKNSAAAIQTGTPLNN